MSIYKIVFSPTGGTQKAADIFTRVLCEKPVEIDLSKAEENFGKWKFQEEDVCVVAVPSYGGRVPEIAASHLKQMQGRNARAVLLVVYGNRAYEDTLLELKDTLKSVGFRCVAALTAVAEHSIMHQFGNGRPDGGDCKELEQFADRISEELEKGNLSEDVDVPGSRPYREYSGIPLKPRAGKKCTACQICAQKCPAGAISKENPRKTDAKLCISCMRCISVCPQGARSLNRLMLAAASGKMKKACSGRKENELFLGGSHYETFD